jgi:hypothetical protein
MHTFPLGSGGDAEPEQRVFHFEYYVVCEMKHSRSPAAPLAITNPLKSSSCERDSMAQLAAEGLNAARCSVIYPIIPAPLRRDP